MCLSLSAVNNRSCKSSPQLGVTLAYFGEREGDLPEKLLYDMNAVLTQI